MGSNKICNKTRVQNHAIYRVQKYENLASYGQNFFSISYFLVLKKCGFLL